MDLKWLVLNFLSPGGTPYFFIRGIMSIFGVFIIVNAHAYTCISSTNCVYRKLAAIKKEEGNKLYTSQDYAGALNLYSEAIGN